jgi:PadR family transcriptional regulator, regulatory protein PadR
MSEKQETMNIQLKKGVLELCVMSLLGRQDRYGYELVSKISKNIDIAEGTIYPLLKRLREDGYVMTYLVESAEGPSRKYYKLTGAGEETLEKLHNEWISFVKGVNLIVSKKEENE